MAQALWNRLLERLRLRSRTAEPLGARKVSIPRIINIKKCQACGKALRSWPTVPCTNSRPHLVHQRCVELVRGKCPNCGFAITGYS